MATLANQKHTVGFCLNGHVRMMKFPDIVGSNVQSLHISMPAWDPIKNEAEIMRYIGQVNVDRNYEIAFEILFNEPIFSKPVNAVEALGRFAGSAEVLTQHLHRAVTE